MKKVLQISNGIALGSTVFINYLSNTGLINDTTIGEVSSNYNSLITPASYTFAIWGLIYLLLLLFAIYQGRSLFTNTKHDDFVLKTGWWFVLSCLFNSFWVFAWLYEYTGLSCIFIFLLLYSLFKVIINNRMEIDDKPFPIIAFVWWPFVVYAGWVTIASIVNVSAYLVKINWNGFGLDEPVWAFIVITIALIINLYLIWQRNLREFGIVGVWAFIGIANANTSVNNSIMIYAYVAAAILLVVCGIHGYKNRATNPFIKFKQWQAKSNS
ncbi:MAG: tryptophan-rich sensory protein [Winogradskyella sp.]|uniref:tryptophan-rich sensory protein n=1 Tax=Winogradskyella sp. TaxID=1883156 RepID=UPI001856F83D|nr:tryptophan-rich sensory protein [Winogradskyella sp.]